MGLPPHNPDAARYAEIRFTAEVNPACKFSSSRRRTALRAAIVTDGLKITFFCVVNPSVTNGRYAPIRLFLDPNVFIICHGAVDYAPVLEFDDPVCGSLNKLVVMGRENDITAKICQPVV